MTMVLPAMMLRRWCRICKVDQGEGGYSWHWSCWKCGTRHTSLGVKEIKVKSKKPRSGARISREEY